MITQNYDLDTDSTLGGNNASDYVIPSQKAIKGYVDNNTGSTVDQVYDPTSQAAQSGIAIAGANFLTSSDLTNYVTTNTDQNITGVKTYVGQKRIGFKQSGSNDKLGFTLYNNNGTEKGYLEFNPTNTIDGAPLMTLGNYASSAAAITHVGFRKYSSISGASGAYNLLAPLISDAKTPFNLTTTYTNFYLPLGFTDGNTTVLTAKSGLVDISSLLPSLSGYATETWVGQQGYITSSALSGYATETWVGNQGYAVASSLATVATSGSYNDLSNKPTIPTVGNGTITINQGGTQKGTFTVNQSGNTTINLDAGGGTVDQTFDGTSANAQSGVAIEGELSTNYVKSSAEDTTLGITSSIGYMYGAAPIMQLNTGTTQFLAGILEGCFLGAIDNTSEVSSVLSVLPTSLNFYQNGSTISLTVSNNNLAINGNEVATLSDIPSIPTVNNATLTIQKNGTTVNTFTANASTDVTANITVPTDLGDLTNNAGYTKNVGTVTSVNNTQPDANGNVSLSIPAEGANKDLSNLTATGEAHFQAPISDLTTIRSGASAGATAVQPSDITDVVRQETADTINLYAWYNSTFGIAYTLSENPVVSNSIYRSYPDLYLGRISTIDSSTSIRVIVVGSTTAEQQFTRDSSNDTTATRSTLTDNNSNTLNITQSDGQWVISQSILVDTDIDLAVNTGRTFDLSSYLPSDNYNYEVLVAAVAQSTSTSGGTVNVSVYSDLITNTGDIKICVGRTRANSTIICGGNAIIPIGTGRTISLHQANISGTASAHKATITNFRAIAYRRIGTNS